MTAPAAPGEGKDQRLPSAAPPKRYAPDAMERAVLQRWAKDRTFQRQVEQGKAAFASDPAARFVFLEGPPTANGRPHPGHVLTRTLKDSVCRYQAMQGKWVPRKGGWDCHGLPVEIEVQKELGIEHVEEVLAYGLAKFNAKCRDSVFRYKAEWEEMCQRVGHWLDYDDPYVTMEDRYIESVWWSLKRMFDAGLLFKSYKVVPYCPQTGTSYSSHEVAQGYKDVTDTAVFVKFKLVDDPDGASILSWTTTPWTLPGNVALAVGADIDYVKVRVTATSDKALARKDEVFILAEALQKKAMRNDREVIWKGKGKDLVGNRYHPLFPGAVDAKAAGPNGVPKKAFQVVAADFVTTEDGTGVVHTAVMYGEDDFQLGMKEGLPARHTVGLDGTFAQQVPGGLAGRYVKAPETEALILAWLRQADLLYREEKYEHSYPHCWRTGHPLLYYAMDSWYVRMSGLRDQLLANNDRINWVPETIKDGRMGDWLRNVKDWAFSRNRFWGTPLPVWTCSKCKAQTCIGSKAELKAAGIDAAELHRPYVDQPLDCPKCHAKGAAIREPYVIDVWYDSGAAQFAQWQTTSFDNKALQAQWPIDFITEGLDQTRGWFYSLLASSTALGASGAPAPLFSGPPFRNCLVGGLILAEDGTKMSKSKKNYVPPDQVFANQGADATRWYLLSTTAPWQDKRFYEEAVRETFGKFFSTLWNTFLFHHQYARLDHWTPAQALPPERWVELDQWLLSRLNATIAEARFEADRLHLHKATRAIESFVVDDLSNWWVRRSRDRFWGERSSKDKQSAHSALWTALHTVCRMVAPFAPFMVEHLWPALRKPDDKDSVHLALWPKEGQREEELEREMAQVRALAEAGRALRSKVDIPTRHPLGRAVLVGGSLGRFAHILQDEINVKQLESAHDTRALKSFVAKPNRKALGQSFKRLSTQVADAIEALDGDAVHAQFAAGKRVGVNIDGTEHELTAEHVQFEERDRPGWATTTVEEVVLALNVERNEELLAEALAREVIRRIQDVRRELDLPIDEEVDITLTCGPNEEARLSRFLHVLKADVRARNLAFGQMGPASTAKGWDIDGVSVAADVRPTKTMRPSAVEAA
ncbi:MAG TPA: isoleucine--tRNA ligase [Candidatus Thermoplasmatota archaeon]|nr:isoleucine--tRNA ligase [Candidatus Thermoplasmatota archaeon]